MTGAAWRLSWRVALRRRRLFAWNVLIPLLLLVPVAASGAAASHRSVVVTVFIAFFGAYGSCIPLIRDGMSGWAEKALLTGYGGGRWLAERTAAAVAVDFLQLLPVNLALFWLVGMSFRGALSLLAATVLALGFANLLGVLVAAAVRALGEAALGCAVISLFALHAAGTFRRPAAGSLWEVAERWSPFRPVHEMWLEALGRGEASLPAAWTPMDAVAPLLSLFVLGAAMVLADGWLAARIAGSRAE